MIFLKHLLFPISEADQKRNQAYQLIVLVLMGVVIGMVSLLLGAASYGVSMFLSYFKVPMLLLLNLVPPVLIILFLYFISGSAWLSYLVTSLLIFSLSVVDFFKIQLRHDPFFAADLGLIGEAKNIMSGYSLTFNLRIAVAVLVLVFGVAFAAVLMRGRIRTVKVRLLGGIGILLVSAVLYGTLYTSEHIYQKASNNNSINIWSELQVFVSKGFVYPFIYSIQDAFPTPPEGYDSDTVAADLGEYAYDDIPADKKVNIISIMLEAYADLSTLNVLDFNVDVYHALHEVQSVSYTGTLIDNVFAGGTINTERSFMTGYTEIDEYRTNTNSFVYYLKEQGYDTEGLHAGDGWFYNRQNVNTYLGFDNYYFLEDYENGNRTDAFFFSEILNLYEKRDLSVPYFNYSLSYQNHGSYSSDSTVDEAYIHQGDLSDESYNILNNYLSGIYDTSNRIADFIDNFRDDSEPVVILIFGDHMPWLGNGNSVYNELGVNIDLSTEDGFYNYYSTPYLIWANDAAKEMLGNDFSGEGADISPCFLMNELFSLCSWQGNEYMKVNAALRSYTDIVNTPTGYYRESDVLSAELSDEAAAFWKRFKNIEYYRQYNFID